MLRNAWIIARKELLVLLKDRGGLAVLFLMPFLLASVLGATIGSIAGGTGDTPIFTVYLVNQDSGAYGAQVAQILEGIGALEIIELDSAEDAEQRVADGEEMAAILLPPDLTARVNAYQPSTVRVVVDPAQEQYGAIISGIMNNVLAPIVLRGELQHGIQAVWEEAGVLEEAGPALQQAVQAQTLGVIMTQMAELLQDPFITLRVEDLEGETPQEEWNAFSWYVPALTVMFTFFLVGSVSETVLQEKEDGTFRRLLAAPLQRGSIVAGKMMAYMLVVCLQVVVLFGMGALAYQMPLGHAPGGLALLTVTLALVSTSLGMLVAGLARTRRQAGAVSMALAFILAAVGGSIFQTYRMGGVVQILSQLTPHAHALEGYARLMIEGGTLVSVLPQIGVLAGMGIVLFALAVWRFRFE